MQYLIFKLNEKITDSSTSSNLHDESLQKVWKRDSLDAVQAIMCRVYILHAYDAAQYANHVVVYAIRSLIKRARAQ